MQAVGQSLRARNTLPQQSLHLVQHAELLAMIAQITRSCTIFIGIGLSVRRRERVLL